MGPDDSSYKNVLKKSGANANKASKGSLFDMIGVAENKSG